MCGINKGVKLGYIGVLFFVCDVCIGKIFFFGCCIVCVNGCLEWFGKIWMDFGELWMLFFWVIW